MNCTIGTFRQAGDILQSVPCDVDVFVAIPYVYIGDCFEHFNEKIKIGAQNVSKFECGAHTGEISAKMLREHGFEYVLVGHSERRIEFLETDEDVNSKLKIALGNNLKPVLCIGEPVSERISGKYLMFLKKQFANSIQGIKHVSLDVAYEPVWAIGSGHPATASEIEEVLTIVKELMAGQSITGRVIYGGSISESNVGEFLKISNCDGFLVGNASLGKDFQTIIDIVSKANKKID